MSVAPQIAAPSQPLKSGTEKVIYSFQGGSDGANPNYGNLIAKNGMLYGNTFAGGSSGSACPPINILAAGCGTAFKVNPSSGAEKVLYSFNGSPDGAHPWAGLISFDGAFYGTTFDGGTGVNCSHLYEVAGCGTVFEVSRSGSESVLYSFEGLTDGQFPQASLVATNGALYGNTNSGGESGNGIIFEWSTSGGKSIVLVTAARN